MGDKIKVLAPGPDGKGVPTIGETMEIVQSTEPWSEYILEDGNKIRVKQAVVSIIKLDQPAPDGTPAYMMQGQPIMMVIPKL
ncbi:hypothetical protein AGMMS4952_23200 [Spirochaetia bacterium]|nr:hypothetical protein AGMMS4952_23200 [Spirochaetia bacterium]